MKKYNMNSDHVNCLNKGYLLILSTNGGVRAAYQNLFHKQILS